MAEKELERIVKELAEAARSRFYGKYRGIVVDVADPMNMGRVSAKVPDVYGDTASPWALPAVPFAGGGYGFCSLPQQNDGVWIEFEAGDPSRPIWTGFWWGDGDLPSPAGANTRVWITPQGHQLVLDDDGSQIQITHASGNQIVVNDTGITFSVDGATMTLTSAGLDVNNGSFTVM